MKNFSTNIATLILAVSLTGCWEQVVIKPETKGVLRDKHWAEPLQKAIKARIPTFVEEDGERRPAESVICIDTSGSVSELDLGKFIQHIHTTLREMNSEPVILIGDTEVDWEGAYEGEETLAPESPAMQAAVWQGRGGTDFRPLIQRAIEIAPDVIIYLTDGFGLMPEIIPEQEVIWIVNEPCRSYEYEYPGFQGQTRIIKVEDERCQALKEFGPVISILDPCAEDAMAGEHCQP